MESDKLMIENPELFCCLYMWSSQIKQILEVLNLIWTYILDFKIKQNIVFALNALENRHHHNIKC
jgi:hypothetical protein